MDAAGRYISLKLTPNASGDAVITLRATDHAALPDDPTILFVEDTFHIIVTPVPDRPVAQADVYDATENVVLTILPASGVLANDFDVDVDTLDPLSVKLVTKPLHGALTLNPDGGFTYTPTAYYYGADKFTYTVADTNADPLFIRSLSGTVTLNIAYVPDPLMILLTPLDKETLHNNTNVVFDWEDYPGVIGYNIQVALQANFSRGASLIVPSSSYTYPSLPVNTTVYWRVRAKLANGTYREWSETRVLKTANPPTSPVLVSPVGNIITTSYKPVLDWKLVGVPGGTTFDHYQVQLDINRDFPTTSTDNVAGVLNHAFTVPSDLPAGVVYYWRVRSWNTVGDYSDWSKVGIFRTPLPLPALLSPINSATVTSLHPTFDWTDVPGATQYYIQFSRSSTKATGGTYLATGSTYTLASNLSLSTNRILYWRIKAIGDSESTWSPFAAFIIKP
jgi:hypothetical protein